MDFKTIKDYNGKNFLGEDIFIPYNTDIELEGNFLYFNGIPFCTKTSEVARRFFVWNGDGNWGSRKLYEDVIYLEPRTVEWEVDIPIYGPDGEIIGTKKQTLFGRFTPTEREYIKNNFPEFLEPGTGIIFNDYFFIGSDIIRVEELFSYLKV